MRLVSTDAAGSALRRSLKITFQGEAGVDEGGILSEMYTLLFEAMMLPRFGLFENCDSPPPPTAKPLGRRPAKDPTEKSFAPRFSGAVAGAAASGAASVVDDPDDVGRFGAYLEPISGSVEEHAEEEEEEEDDDAGSDDDGDSFEARREAERSVVEGAAASGAGGGEGRAVSVSKMLPAARPGGYSDAQLGRYRAIGRLMVKCLLEGRRIGSRLAPSVFKFITGTDTTLRDLQDFDSQSFESLKWMLANTGMRDMGFDFEDVGLPDKGPVTDGNKAEYVSAKARLILVGSRRPALEALKAGFAEALRDLSPGAALFVELLSHADWRVLLCGEEHVSGPQVVAVLTWYGFPTRSEVPTWVKSLLLSLPEDALLRFVSSPCVYVCWSLIFYRNRSWRSPCAVSPGRRRSPRPTRASSSWTFPIMTRSPCCGTSCCRPSTTPHRLTSCEKGFGAAARAAQAVNHNTASFDVAKKKKTCWRTDAAGCQQHCIV
ncbi:unnamed protein product [Ectocarpus sp. 6 AP-2014]